MGPKLILIYIETGRKSPVLLSRYVLCLQVTLEASSGPAQMVTFVTWLRRSNLKRPLSLERNLIVRRQGKTSL